MQVIIDPFSGPCPGVQRAIKMLERELEDYGRAVALGQVIHNAMEINRLRDKGLVTVTQNEEPSSMDDTLRDQRVFIRSHGISDEYRRSLQASDVTLVDGTCPTVAAIQKKIRRYDAEGYQVVIAGKKGHPEVVGLAGCGEKKAIVLQDENDVEQLDVNGSYYVVAQTTISPDLFNRIIDRVKGRVKDVVIEDTTCRHVTRRHEKIRNFARQVDVLLLVGGKNSSNTGVLFRVAHAVNAQTIWIESADELDPEMFSTASTVGITGSASTPVWQLHRVKEVLENNMAIEYKSKVSPH